MVLKAQMGEPETLEGKVLAGRYRLEHQLGEGGFGTIWRAEQLVLGATVAIKLIDLAIARQAGALERFLREAQAAATLRSPHVVQVLDYGVDGDQPFIAMELLEGETLAQRLHRLGRLAPSEALRIVTHIARAMTRAHECNIVHRDLKPDNVFLVRNEDEEVTKVLDFGVAKIKNPDWMDESTQTRTGSLIGTPHYMSPEQVQGNKAVDYRSDLWSLGVIAFEMFTGQRPFVGNALGDLVLQICVREMPVPSRLAPVPAGFDEWFAKAAERDPDRRFQSARDLAAALREVVGGGERDIELVVADDIDTFRAAPTQENSSSRSSIEASNGKSTSPRPVRDADSAASPIELANTLLGQTVEPRVQMGSESLESLPSLHSANAGGITSERGLGRIVFVVMAALLLVLISLGAFWRSKNGSASRTNFVAAPTPIARSDASQVVAADPQTRVAPERSATVASAAPEHSAKRPTSPKRAQLATRARPRARGAAASTAQAAGTRVKPAAEANGSGSTAERERESPVPTSGAGTDPYTAPANQRDDSTPVIPAPATLPAPVSSE
jgi:serine/threonine-protein kinase